jgi:hypothetical protein
MERRIAYMNREAFERDLRFATEAAETYEEYRDLLDRIKSGAKTIEEVEEYLEKETGFKNHQMAADALNLGKFYKRAVLLFDEVDHLDVDTLLQEEKGEWKVNSEWFQNQKEKWTVYFEEYDSKQLDVVERALGLLNSIDPFYCVFSFNRYDRKFKLDQKAVWDKLQEKKRADQNAARGR